MFLQELSNPLRRGSRLEFKPTQRFPHSHRTFVGVDKRRTYPVSLLIFELLVDHLPLTLGVGCDVRVAHFSALQREIRTDQISEQLELTITPAKVRNVRVTSIRVERCAIEQVSRNSFHGLPPVVDGFSVIELEVQIGRAHV